MRTFFLEKGRVVNKVSHSRLGQDRYEISTPLAVASVRGTEFRTQVTDNSQIEVTGGKVAVIADREVLVPAGSGVKVNEKGIGELVKLPPAPKLAGADQVQDLEDVRFVLPDQDGISRWHLVLATDPEFSDILMETFTNEKEAIFKDLADGYYFLRASIIDKNGVEGFSSEYQFHRQRYDFASRHTTSGTGIERVHRFDWKSHPDPSAAFLFVLRSEGSDVPIFEIKDLSRPSISLAGIMPGRYTWSVGIVSSKTRTIRWDTNRELQVEY